METVIKLLINDSVNKLTDMSHSKYNEIIKMIEINNINVNDMVSLMYYFILTKKNILTDEKTLSLILIIIKTKNMKYKILENLLKILKETKYQTSLHILNKIRKNLKMKNEINELLNLMSKGNIYEKIKNERINDIKEIITKILNSFNDKKFNNTISNEYTKTNNINSINNILIYINKNEILTRIIQLINIFGLKIFEFMNVRIIKVEEYNKFNYQESVKYYNECVDSLILFMSITYDIIHNYNNLNQNINKILEMKESMVDIENKDNKQNEINSIKQDIINIYLDDELDEEIR